MSAVKGAPRAAGAGRYKPYPAYKDSDVEWLGAVPSHWTESKVKFLGRYINGYPFKPDDWSVDGRPIIRIQNLTNPDAPFNRFPGDIDPRYLVTRGDILISWSASLGLFIWSETEDAWLNQHIFKIVLREGFVDRAYFVWLGDWFIRELQKETHGSTMTHLTYGMFGGFRVDLPPAKEQRAIAAFLDRETARIDALVAKKERLIVLLQEQRTALITRAVTKGLDPTVPMKDSGVEWLGEIPAHWEVAPVYARYEVALGKMLDAKRVTGESSGPYLRNVDVQWDMVNTEGLPEMDFSPWERDRYSVRPGDVLVCEGGEVGRTAIWRGEIEPCFYQKALHRVRPRAEREVPRFFFYLMYMVAKRGVFAGGGNQNTIDHLTAIQLKHYRFPFAPEPEQRAIAALLDRETARIDSLIAKVREAIERLKELRTALISAAVTGKIDVREEVS